MSFDETTPIRPNVPKPTVPITELSVAQIEESFSVFKHLRDAYDQLTRDNQAMINDYVDTIPCRDELDLSTPVWQECEDAEPQFTEQLRAAMLRSLRIPTVPLELGEEAKTDLVTQYLFLSGELEQLVRYVRNNEDKVTLRLVFTPNIQNEVRQDQSFTLSRVSIISTEEAQRRADEFNAANADHDHASDEVGPESTADAVVDDTAAEPGIAHSEIDNDETAHEELYISTVGMSRQALVNNIVPFGTDNNSIDEASRAIIADYKAVVFEDMQDAIRAGHQTEAQYLQVERDRRRELLEKRLRHRRVLRGLGSAGMILAAGMVGAVSGAAESSHMDYTTAAITSMLSAMYQLWSYKSKLQRPAGVNRFSDALPQYAKLLDDELAQERAHAALLMQYRRG